MTRIQRRAVMASIRAAFRQHAPGPVSITQIKAQGKLYELRGLATVVRCLRMYEGLEFALMGGSALRLRGNPGYVDRNFSYLEVSRSGSVVGEIMLDVQFLTLSFFQRMRNPTPFVQIERADYHELDIAFIREGLPENSLPFFEHIFLAAECKDTAMSKGFVRNMLGLRRELSLLTSTNNNPVLNSWPRQDYSSAPPSALLLYCNDQRVRNYRSMGTVFDIEMRFLRM